MRSVHILFSSQRGATLVVTLIMLLLLLMLATVGMRAMTIETRIAASLAEHQQQVEVAEAALRAGERAFINGFWRGKVVEQCASGMDDPHPSSEILCYTDKVFSETGPNAEQDRGRYTQWQQVTAVHGFESTGGLYGYWYPRYIGFACNKGKKGCSHLAKPGTGDTVFYEINAQVTRSEKPKECGAPEVLCLRSVVNQFIL